MTRLTLSGVLKVSGQTGGGRGRVGSLRIALVLFWQQDLDMVLRWGRGQPIIVWAVLMTLCTALLYSAMESGK